MLGHGSNIVNCFISSSAATISSLSACSDAFVFLHFSLLVVIWLLRAISVFIERVSTRTMTDKSANTFVQSKDDNMSLLT
jgi:hypothetical protein